MYQSPSPATTLSSAQATSLIKAIQLLPPNQPDFYQHSNRTIPETAKEDCSQRTRQEASEGKHCQKPQAHKGNGKLSNQVAVEQRNSSALSQNKNSKPEMGQQPWAMMSRFKNKTQQLGYKTQFQVMQEEAQTN